MYIMYTCLQFTDKLCDIQLVYSDIPEDGHNIWPKHVEALKLIFVQYLETNRYE